MIFSSYGDRRRLIREEEKKNDSQAYLDWVLNQYDSAANIDEYFLHHQTQSQDSPRPESWYSRTFTHYSTLVINGLLFSSDSLYRLLTPATYKE